MKWISVKERLPSELDNVLVFDEEKGKSIAFYFQTLGCFIRDIDGLRLNRVTYYIELPENPD